MSVAVHEPQLVPVGDLRPHPRNYRQHPDDQLEHLAQSLHEHGLYRNVVAARDGTILAGHGVVEAAKRAGLPEVRVIRLDLDPADPKALKILAGDNELARLGEIDDRALSEILREIRDVDMSGLLGTGYDDEALATLLRIADARSGALSPFDEWNGMPEFEQADRQSVFHTTVHFATEEEADRFFKLVGASRRSSFWWPATDGLVGSDASRQWVASG